MSRAPSGSAQEATGAITGTVTDAETGEAIESAICVEVIEEDWASEGGEAVTAADGTYRVDGVPVADNWWVSFRDCADGIYKGQFFDGTQFAFEADLVSVGEDEETGIDAALPGVADEDDSEETTTAPLPAPADAGGAGLAGGVPWGVGAGLALVGILLGAVLAVRTVVARRTPAER